ncbi:MAG: hypothetical protein H6944_02310 [Zoogloeaceae bacterium]|nr:hypothetical protein [Zoogloeaceae bacterium]
MLFDEAFELLKQISTSKIGVTPSNGYLKVASLNVNDGPRNDALLSILESARRTLSLDYGGVEFLFYDPSPTEKMVALRGPTAESVHYFNFQELAVRIGELVNEVLGDWQPYDLAHGDVLYRLDSKVIEIAKADLEPLRGTVLVKGFTFGGPIGAENRASTIGEFIVDVLRNMGAPESTSVVRWSESASVVVISPAAREFLRGIASKAPPQSPQPKSWWQRVRGA